MTTKQTERSVEEIVEEFFEQQDNIWKSETGLTIAQAKKAEIKLLKETLQAERQKREEAYDMGRKDALSEEYKDGFFLGTCRERQDIIDKVKEIKEEAILIPKVKDLNSAVTGYQKAIQDVIQVLTQPNNP